ncbi:MAG: serine/threonine protein kinase [Oscillatoriales cyanobacterium]|nr:MAG: serine/threonine protein kinase [Oscillatoriales cyanobacterium]TAF46030.1 MAG: serine/threonine protein kinase [Oscillatoriales cyanobacterium]
MIIGKTIGGHYYIISLLGQGGFGETYLARDEHLPDKPPRVVKRFKPQSNEPFFLQTAKRLFDSESIILDKLGSHDRIPQLFAYFDENQEFYLIQELIAGHDLSDELNPPHQMAAKGVQFSESQVIQLLYDILDVLRYVHQQNIIHRDIKPSNLMRRDADGRIILIDFGAVKEIGSKLQYSQGQPRTVTIGTEGYMPSEQENGHPKLCSDVYAVGMTAIQALTGVFPHQLPKDPNTLEVMWRDRVSVSPKFAAILDIMVRYQWQQRYQSADEALSAIQPLVASSTLPTIVSSPPGLPWLNSPAIKKMLIGLVSLGIFAVGGMFVAQFVRTQPAQQPTYIPRKEPVL